MSLYDRVLCEGEFGQYDVPVDTGSVIVVDPCYLFNHEEWTEILGPRTEEGFNQGQVRDRIFAKLKSLLGRPFVEGAYVSTGGDAVFKVKRGERGTPIVIEEKEWDTSFKVSVRGDEGGLRKLLEYIRDTAGVGHSFEVVVDPDDRQYRKRFGIDGDGPFRMEVR